MNALHELQVGAMDKVFALAAELGPAVTAELASEGLTPARVGLVNRIHRGGATSQRALSESLGCTPRNVTGLVDAIESLGLAERRPDPSDRRAVLVALTAAGESAAASWEKRAADMADRLLGDVPVNDLERLVTTLDILLDRLRASAGDARSPNARGGSEAARGSGERALK